MTRMTIDKHNLLGLRSLIALKEISCKNDKKNGTNVQKYQINQHNRIGFGFHLIRSDLDSDVISSDFQIRILIGSDSDVYTSDPNPNPTRCHPYAGPWRSSSFQFTEIANFNPTFLRSGTSQICFVSYLRP